MKTLRLLLAIGIMLALWGCDHTKNTVSGIYVMSFKNEYSIANDTLIIEAYNLSSGTYQIEKRSGYHRIRNGKILSKEFKQEKWMGALDEKKQVLQETALGRQIYIDAGHQSVTFDGKYQKIQ